MITQQITLPAVLAAAIGCTAVNAGGSYWSTDGLMASTSFDTGVHVAVMFPQETGCHAALFAVLGNNRIDAMRFTIDGRPFNLVLPVKDRALGVPYSGFVLSKDGLRGLQRGARLFLETDEGSLSVSLSGSADAFTRAWSNCRAKVGI